MNKCFLIGRLTAAPEYKMTSNSTLAKYTLAVDRRDKDRNTDFFNITAFGKAADFADQYLIKGMRVAVVGRIQLGSYVNKDGQRVNTIDIIAEDQEFADSKRQDNSNTQNDSNDYGEW